MVTFRTVAVGEQEIKLVMNAYVPMAYRARTQRDLIADLGRTEKAMHDAVKALPEGASDKERETASIGAVDISVFANLGYIMAEEAGMELPPSTKEWLRSFENPAMIYKLIVPILELWRESNKTTSIAAKK